MKQIALIALAAMGACAAVLHPSEHEHRVAVARGVELRVVEAGRNTGLAPLVFIPGWSMSADIWRDQLTRFAGDRRVVSFDPRSQGASTITPDGNTPEQRAEDLHVLLTEEHFARRPVLVAWSQAVQDVAAYVGRYGAQDVAGIVLVDAAISRGQPPSADESQMLGIYRAHQREYLEGMMPAIISSPQSPEFMAALVATGMRTPPTVGVDMLMADMHSRDRTPSLAGFTAPTLIIASFRSDELELQRAAAAAIPGARFVVIDDGAHAVFIDQPDRFSGELQRFLAALPSPAAPASH